MKKIFFIALFLFIAEASLYSWEPNDLTKFPDFTKNGDCILNLGIGFGERVFYGGGYVYVPPVRLSFDINTALGDRKLPFFFGGIVSYMGEGYKKEWFVHRLSTGMRVGYHFNWGVKNLDTYAVTTAGWRFNIGDRHERFSDIGDFLFDVNFGARYFVSKGFGFWVELGYGYLPVSFVDIGFSFKF